MGFPSFGDLLKKRLKSQGLSLRDFARQAGVPPSFVARVMDGERAVPTSRIDAWGNLLDLDGQDRTEFIDAAM